MCGAPRLPLCRLGETAIIVENLHSILLCKCLQNIEAGLVVGEYMEFNCGNIVSGDLQRALQIASLVGSHAIFA